VTGTPRFAKQSEGGTMSTQRIYALPVETTQWRFDGATEIQFDWEYDNGSGPLLDLYEKGKQQQWDSSKRLDWSLELDPENPMQLKDESISIYHRLLAAHDRPGEGLAAA
jgi:uncharacterized protein (DUF2235 family)